MPPPENAKPVPEKKNNTISGKLLQNFPIDNAQVKITPRNFVAAFVYDYQYLLASILNYLYKEQTSYNYGRISCMTRENCNRFDQQPRGPDLISKNIRMQIRSLDSKVIRCDMTEHALNQPRTQCFSYFPTRLWRNREAAMDQVTAQLSYVQDLICNYNNNNIYYL